MNNSKELATLLTRRDVGKPWKTKNILWFDRDSNRVLCEYTYPYRALQLLQSALISTYLPTYLPTHPPTYLPTHGSTALCWVLVAFLVSWSFYTVGRTPWTGDQLVARPLPGHRTAQTQNKRTKTFMPRVGFEPTTAAFEPAKIAHALDRAATVIGMLCSLTN
jgi:hypothetical protein